MRSKKTAILLGMVAALLGMLPTPASAVDDRTDEGRPPNFVFLLSDDQGWGDLGVYGHGRLQTPNLDRLAREGTLFTQFYVASPACSSARASFMTGRFPAGLRIHMALYMTPEKNERRGQVDYLDPGLPTVTRMLQQAGYITGHFGKWHLGVTPDAPDPRAYGIDDHRTTMSTGPRFEVLGRDPFFISKVSGLAVDEACRFIEDNRYRPFYVAVWFNLLHARLNPTEEQTQPYTHLAPRGMPDRGANQIYYAAVTDLDTQAGRILQKLEDLGLAEDTVVLFASDNGPEDIALRSASHSGVGSAGPLRGRKRSLYEGGVRVPFLARWPGHIVSGRVSDSVISSVDFLPTISRMAGIEVPQTLNLDGEDVSDILLGASRDRTKPLRWEWRFAVLGHVFHRSPMLAIREGDWKLLMNPDRSRLELYDLSSDVREMNNLAGSTAPGIERVVRRLSHQLLQWHATLPEGPVSDNAGKDDYPMPMPTDSVPRSQPPQHYRGERTRLWR